jgi:hypothetical protein
MEKIIFDRTKDIEIVYSKVRQQRRVYLMKQNSKYIKSIIVNYLKTNIESELNLFELIDKTNEVRSGDVICSKKIINDILSELEIEGLIEKNSGSLFELKDKNSFE